MPRPAQDDLVLVLMGAPGGIGRFERLLLDALAVLASAQRLRVHVLQLAPRRQGTSPTPFRVYSSGGSHARLAHAYIATLLRHPGALVIFGHVNLAPLALLQAWPGRVAGYMVLAYGIDVWEPLRPLRRLALRRASSLLAISGYTADRLVDAQRVQARRVQLLPCAYTPPSRQLTSAVHDAGSPRLLSVSRLDAEEGYKGIDHVLQSIPALRDAHPALRYDVIGAGTDLARLQALAHDLGVAGNVAFRGHVSDAELEAAYAGCDIFVLPSGKEGFGLVFLEAMAHAKPVLAARAGGAPEVVVDGETGLLVPYGDVSVLTVAMHTLLADPVLRAQLGANGRARLHDHFSFDGFVERLQAILAEAGVGSSASPRPSAVAGPALMPG